MNIEIITEWVKLDIIKYLIIATTILGLINCIKIMVRR